MKKFSLLPLAKIVEDEYSLFDEYGKNNFRIRIPSILYVIMFCITLAGMFLNIAVGIFLFGTVFLMAGLDSSATTKHNRKVVENNFRNRLPFLITGSTIMDFVLAAVFADKEEKGAGTTFHATKASTAILKTYAVALAVFLLCRLLWLIAATIASSARKRRCTCSMFAKYIIPDEPNDKHIFKYEYEGTSYWFTYKSSFYDEMQDVEIFIDPDAPEFFYLYDMMNKNGRDLKKFISTLFIFLLITAIIWVPIVWVYFVTPHMVEKW